MTIKDKLQAQPWFNELMHRQETVSSMVEYFASVAATGLNQIIETGTARQKGNWSGDGQSTLIWDWLAHQIPNVKVLSIDLDPIAIETVRAQTKKVEFLTGDSIQHLPSLPVEIISHVGLLYLDSMDWDFERGYISACHHLVELQSVWDRLPVGCMIAVDDVHGDNQGKHVAIQEFMIERNISPKFKGHQIGWIKT
jgi:trans-aconitate methyltransferase